MLLRLFVPLGIKRHKSSQVTAFGQVQRCFSVVVFFVFFSVIPSGPGAFLVFAFFKASCSSFMMKGSVMEQSHSSPYDDSDVLCFLSNLLDTLSSNMSGALYQVKVCKTFAALFSAISSLFASMNVLLFEGLSLFNTLVRFQRPVVAFFHYGVPMFSCQLFLVACVFALVYCPFAFPCASTFVFVGELSMPSSLFLGLRPYASCQALESSRADSHGAFKNSLVKKSNTVDDVGFWQFQCSSFPVHRLSESIPAGCFCSSSLLVACFFGAMSGL